MAASPSDHEPASDGSASTWEYRRTHPWLTFTVPLDRGVPIRLWMLLGECESKCEHLAGVPLRPDVAARMMRVYLAKGVLASAAIEGNTLTEEQALAHVEGTLRTAPSQAYLKTEIDNILRVQNEFAKEILEGAAPPYSVQLFKGINRRILEGLEVDDHVTPGEIPTVDIGVGRYKGAPRSECEHLLERLADWLNGDWDEGDHLGRIPMAIIKAVIAHLYLAWIHPFADGNGRTARLIEVMILLRSGLPQPACQLLSNHYNATRDRYYRELQRASESGGDIVPFLHYAVEGFRDGLGAQIAEVRELQWEVAWINYVHELFHEQDGVTAKRQRELVLGLTRSNGPVPRARLTAVSPRVAELYAPLTPKTLSRDLEALEEKRLIRREPAGYVANREMILAFLPAVAPS